MSNRPLKDGVGTQETINSTTGQIDLIFNAFTDKATPVDTDIFAVEETGGLFKKVTWANIKATAKTYFDTLYSSKLVAAFTSGTIDGVAIGGTTPAAIAGTTLNVGATSPTISVIRETVRTAGSTDNASLVSESGIRAAIEAGGGGTGVSRNRLYLGI